MKFSLIANPEKYSVREPLEEIVKWCDGNKSTLFISEELHNHYQNISDSRAVTSVVSETIAVEQSDIVIAVGGDGTMLHTAHLLKGIDKPVLGVNTGKLGFMANIQPSEIVEALHFIAEGNYTVDERSMLKATTSGNVYYALNEFLFSKKDASSLITLDVEYDNELVNNYWADGLIISSPTGSTAYNLSAGGPIILPNTPVIVLTPINPHTLTTRPLVLPAQKKIRVRAENKNDQILFAYDGIMLPYNNRLDVEINQSEFLVSLIQLPGHNYFETLRTKLMWGMDKRKV